MRKSNFKYFVYLFLVLAVTGCKPPQSGNKCFVGTVITVPSSDLTPPSSVMDIHSPNKPIITVTSTTPMSSTVAITDTITLIANGSDPEGIKDIQIWVEETWWRDVGGITTQTGPGLLGAPEASNADNTAVGGSGCSARLATLNLYIKPRSKNSSRYRIRAWATAVNFSGAQVKTAEVTLTWP